MLVTITFPQYGLPEYMGSVNGVIISWDHTFQTDCVPDYRTHIPGPYYRILTSENGEYSQSKTISKRKKMPTIFTAFIYEFHTFITGCLNVVTNCEIVQNSRLGIFFSHYNGSYYVPNRILNMEFPDDQLFIQRFVSTVNGPPRSPS